LQKAHRVREFGATEISHIDMRSECVDIGEGAISDACGSVAGPISTRDSYILRFGRMR
jgi:hypothetical protein